MSRPALSLFVILLLGGAPQRTRAAGRVVLAIGSNVGLPHEPPLRHAIADARRVAALFADLGGVAPADAQILADPSAAAALAAIARAAVVPGGDDTVFVYFSGHGDAQSLHTGGERLTLSALQAAVAALPARLKILIVDACRTDGDHAKGIARADSFVVEAPSAPPYAGLVTLYGAGPGESAQESSRLAGGVFTHYLLSGLRGAADRDGDGRVTLAEVYDFVYGRTLAHAVAGAGQAQRPEIALELKGQGPLVLTQLQSARARLVLPAGTDTHYLVYERGSATVMTEAWAQPTRGPTLALPAGRFVVQRHGGDRPGAVEVTLTPDREVHLPEAEFLALGVDTERMFARGGQVDLRQHAFALTTGMATDGGGLIGPALGVSFAWWRDDVVWHSSLGAGRLVGRTDANDVEDTQLDATFGHGRRWVGRHVTLAVAGELAMRLSRQRLSDRRVAGPSDWRPAPRLDQALLPGAGAKLSLGRPIGERLGLLAEASARVFALRERDASDDGAEQTRWRARADLSLRVGLAMAF